MMSLCIRTFGSFLFLSLAAVFVITGRLSAVCCATPPLILVCILAAFCTARFYHGQITFYSAENRRQRFLYAVPVTLFYIVTVNLALPGTLYLNNRREITIQPSAFARALLAGALVHFLLIAGLGILLLTQRQLELFYTALFAVTLAGYLQDMLLNGQLLAMDGSRQEWSPALSGLNALIWALLIAGVFLLKILLRQKASVIYRFACLYLCLVQSASLGYLAVSSLRAQEPASSQTVLVPSTNGSLELHPDNNVLVFILDWYDTQIIQEILSSDPDFLAPLDGFTYYPNATSLYAFTEMSVPYLLSGVEWQYGMDTDEYIDYAYRNGTVLDDIAASGYEISLYTQQLYINGGIGFGQSKFSNGVVARRSCHIPETVNLTTQCARYQMAPYLVKNIYWYTTDALTALAFEEGYTSWTAAYDSPFAGALLDTGLSIDQAPSCSGYFKLYHMNGAHPPFRLTEDFTDSGENADYASMLTQARGSMRIVYEYIRQLKALGLYDSATIVITADHGQNYIYDPSEYRAGKLKEWHLQNTSNPILFVKNAGQAGTELQTNTAPVSHTELIASVISAVNPQALPNYGRPLEAVAETEDRVRTFVFTREDFPYVKAEIRGDVLDPDSWSIVERSEPEDK